MSYFILVSTNNLFPIHLSMSSEIFSSSLSQCQTPPRQSSLSKSLRCTSTSIKRSLLHDKLRYRVENNLSKRATAACWKVFGFPAMSTDDDPSKLQTITRCDNFSNCSLSCHMSSVSSTELISFHHHRRRRSLRTTDKEKQALFDITHGQKQ